ncbi:hypothetical protein Smp_142420 [Schistosoma mansoni]|uniref:hypothetical protein n=1 Tax=Schistosoma mansoni TaxID=6183 RepID=UPI0001A6375B|nr:hypothetical protein Smp_142420 [Schistosoma mansoni]|eukprot:XP_018649728.1 hypothetical protein Smp_142420 [Schistosoma mansoni]
MQSIRDKIGGKKVIFHNYFKNFEQCAKIYIELNEMFDNLLKNYDEKRLMVNEETKFLNYIQYKQLESHQVLQNTDTCIP